MIVANLLVDCGGWEETDESLFRWLQAPRWQVFVLTKTQIIFLILGAPVLHDVTSLLGLCVKTEHKVQFPAQLCCYYTGSLPSQT